MSAEASQPISMLLVEEYFDREDERFLPSLRQISEWRKLAGFAGRWKKDHRPWARRQIFRYLQHPLNAPGHQPLVKQLFKHAEENRDDDSMASFLVVFDGLARYQRITKWQWDWESRQSWSEDVLRLPRNTIPLAMKQVKQIVNPFTREAQTLERTARYRESDRLFSYRTRYYLRRRAWRYFRRLGFQRPEAYCQAVTKALSRYRNESLTNGEDILESWGLMHACFGTSEHLEKTPSHIGFQAGKSFADLKPSPYFPELWRSERGFDSLFALLVSARSQLVQNWAMELLDRDHEDRLAAIKITRLIPLLNHDEDSISEFAARWFQRSAELATLSLDDWFQLLDAPNVNALDLICRSMSEHVRADRLSLQDCVRLACAAPVPVARMGLDWLQERSITTDDDRELLRQCAGAKCVATAGEMTTWVLSHFSTADRYDREQATAFLDSLNSGCRSAAWDWLVGGDSPGRDDPVLWSRLVESPYDDIRLPLIDVLQRRTVETGLSNDLLTPVWSAVLAGVHRGGRAKLKAIEQIKAAILKEPRRLDDLLPVLCIAVRSVRGPEMAAGLSAVVEIVTARPELEPAIRSALTELSIVEEPV